MPLARALAALTALVLLPGLATVPALAGPPVDAATGSTSELRPAPKGGGYRAEITRTRHGIPHIEADDWGSLGYGEGYAAAETSICTLADTVLTARGERSRFLGADARYQDHVTLDATNLQSDTLFSDIRRVTAAYSAPARHDVQPVESLAPSLPSARNSRPARREGAA